MSTLSSSKYENWALYLSYLILRKSYLGYESVSFCILENFNFLIYSFLRIKYCLMMSIWKLSSELFWSWILNPKLLWHFGYFPFFKLILEFLDLFLHILVVSIKSVQYRFYHELILLLSWKHHSLLSDRYYRFYLAYAFTLYKILLCLLPNLRYYKRHI